MLKDVKTNVLVLNEMIAISTKKKNFKKTKILELKNI